MRQLQTELERIEREMHTLQAQKSLIVRLMRQSGADSTGLEVAARPVTVGPAKGPKLRPKDASATQAVIDAVRTAPGQKLIDAARLAADRLGDTSEVQVKRLYNIGYGLIRRGTLVKSEVGGGVTIPA